MIYTKRGDTGTTSLVGGTRVKKYDIRVSTYGEIDHLVSLLGYMATFLKHGDLAGEIYVIQCKLFEIESMVACEDEQTLMKVPQVQELDVDYLERKINEKTTNLPPLQGFIIPSGSQSGCLIHMARTQTRKCERLLAECNDTYPQSPVAMKYMNRLSDYLFTLARYVMMQKKRPEKYWKSPQRS